MVFAVELETAQSQFPEYQFVRALTPSEQKAAFHVRDSEGVDLCLKIISPDYCGERLQREIQAMQQITHRNVVTLREYTYSSKASSFKHFILEEFIPGNDLADEIKNPWSRRRVAHVFAELMDGLEQLRTIGVVHRDLKPTNIRLRPDDSPVIIDFGLSRHLNLVDLTATSDGAQIGTPMYFAPEQFTGNKRDIDHRTDLFAAGVIMFESLTGRHPFYTTGMTRAELQREVVEGNGFLTSDEFESLPSKWKLLLEKLLEKQRARRVNSADQAAKLLRQIRDL